MLSLKHVDDINISASPHRTLNNSRGIIHYRDDDLSELPDAEICNELEPQGIINVKRFISRKTGQEVKIKHLFDHVQYTEHTNFHPHWSL